MEAKLEDIYVFWRQKSTNAQIVQGIDNING